MTMDVSWVASYDEPVGVFWVRSIEIVPDKWRTFVWYYEKSINAPGIVSELEKDIGWDDMIKSREFFKGLLDSHGLWGVNYFYEHGKVPS